MLTGADKRSLCEKLGVLLLCMEALILVPNYRDLVDDAHGHSLPGAAALNLLRRFRQPHLSPLR